MVHSRASSPMSPLHSIAWYLSSLVDRVYPHRQCLDRRDLSMKLPPSLVTLLGLAACVPSQETSRTYFDSEFCDIFGAFAFDFVGEYYNDTPLATISQRANSREFLEQIDGNQAYVSKILRVLSDVYTTDYQGMPRNQAGTMMFNRIRDTCIREGWPAEIVAAESI